MKVILLERVGKPGHIGDEVTVKDGFARNFLLPQHKALRATEANRKKFEVERASSKSATPSAAKPPPASPPGLNGKTVVMIRQAGETGQLYGSVSSRDVADALAPTASPSPARRSISPTRSRPSASTPCRCTSTPKSRCRSTSTSPAPTTKPSARPRARTSPSRPSTTKPPQEFAEGQAEAGSAAADAAGDE